MRRFIWRMFSLLEKTNDNVDFRKKKSVLTPETDKAKGRPDGGPSLLADRRA